MANSQFCIQQRQQEQQKTKRLLVLGLTGSALLHGILAWAMPKWSIEPPKIAEPMELTIIEKPKPKPKPKIESKPIVKPEPKPIPKPEPIKAQTPPPPVKPPEPVKAQTTPPKPIPKKVLTTPTPAPSQPIVSAPIENTPKAPSLSSSFTAPSSTVTSAESTSNNPGVPSSPVATNSAPPRPKPSSSEGISCISNCEPEYPAALGGTEGSAGVKLTIDPNGNVIGAELTSPHSNSQVNREALLAARQMQFSSWGENASVRVKIEFTVAGSEYDRAAREAQEQRERAERERKEQEAARQQQLEAERQARQQQLERERQARQQQLQQQQESTPPPTDTQPVPKPLPAPLENEVDDEMLRKFRERIENYQN